jgi:hypothetical protein
LSRYQTGEWAVGANNHSPSFTWANTQLNSLNGPGYQASKVRPYAAISIVVQTVGAKLVFARQAKRREASMLFLKFSFIREVTKKQIVIASFRIANERKPTFCSSVI